MFSVYTYLLYVGNAFRTNNKRILLYTQIQLYITQHAIRRWFRLK